MHNWSDLFRKILRLSKIPCPTSTHIIWNVPEKTNFPLRLLNWACVGWKLCKHPANAKVKKEKVVSGHQKQNFILTQSLNAEFLPGQTNLSAKFEIVRNDLQPSEQYKSVSTVNPCYLDFDYLE